MGLKNTSQSTQTTTPNPQALAAYDALLPTAASTAATPYQAYGGEGVAPVNPEQYAGISGINENAYSALPYIGEAEGLASSAAQPISAADIQQYVNPYTANVVNSTEAQFANTNAQQEQQVEGNAIAQGAFGGNREAVAQGILAGQQQTAEAPVIAGLESSGYTQGVNTAETEQQAAESGAANVGSLGVAGENAALTGANAQVGAGSLEQTTQQAQDTYNYQQFLNQLAYPFQTTQWQAGIDTGVGSQMGGTSQTDVDSSILNSLFGGLTSGTGLLGATGAFGTSGWLSPAISALARGGGVPADGVANRMPTVPESPRTLRLQQKQLIAGHRRVQLFPYGSRELPLPHGMSKVSVHGEVFHFNPKRISAAEIRRSAEHGDEHHLLDLGPFSKHEIMARLHGGEIPVAVVERHPDGTEVRAAAGTHVTAPHQAAHMARTMSPGHQLHFEDPRHTVLSRVRHHRADGGMVPGFDLGGSATGVAAAPYGAMGSPYGSAKIWIPQSSMARGPGAPKPPQAPQQQQPQQNSLANQAKSVGQLANSIRTGMNTPAPPTVLPSANGVAPSPVGSMQPTGVDGTSFSPVGFGGSSDDAIFRRGGRVPHHYASGGGDSSADMMMANGINPDLIASAPDFFGETAAEAGRLPSMVPQYADGGGDDTADVSANGVVPAQTDDSILVPTGYGAGPPVRLAANDGILPPEITTGTSGAPPSLTNAILHQESGNRNDVGVSTDNAHGPGQILPQTFSQYAKPGERINDPDDNRAVSKRILDDYWHRYGGDPARAAVAYFSGPGNVAPLDSPTPWIKDARDSNGKSTSSYVSDVLNRGTGEPGTSGLAAPSHPSAASGVAPSPDIDWSSKSKLWPSLIMAGGAMMASHSTSPGVALGEGIMVGAQTYDTQKHEEQAAQLNQKKIDLEARKLDDDLAYHRRHLDIETKDSQTRADAEKSTADWRKRMNLTTTGRETIDGHPIMIDRYSGQTVDGTTGDPIDSGIQTRPSKMNLKPSGRETPDGHPVLYDATRPGVAIDGITGQEVSGDVQTRPAQHSAGAVEGIANRLMEENQKQRRDNPTVPEMSFQEALALAHRAPNQDQETIRRLTLAQGGWKAWMADPANMGKKNAPESALDYWEKRYGVSAAVPAAPGATPAATAPGAPATKPPVTATAPQQTQQPTRPSGVPPDAKLQRSKATGTYRWVAPDGTIYAADGTKQ